MGPCNVMGLFIRVIRVFFVLIYVINVAGVVGLFIGIVRVHQHKPQLQHKSNNNTVATTWCVG